MHSVSKYLAKHSQKIALACAIGTLSTTYVLQPYYEVLARWSLVQFTHYDEDEPPNRISRLFEDVCSQFNLTKHQKAQLDLFVTPLDESLALGSLQSKGYAFVGIPKFFGYENASQIPLNSLDFYSPHFPYGPFSPTGQQRLNLMVVPESAVRFVLARELVRLQGQTKDGLQLGASSRTHAMVTVGGMIGALYLAYQAAFILNRSYCLHWLPTRRYLLCTGLSALSLFCQHQLLLAWRRYRSSEADRIVASLGEPYRQGGLDYYRWRLNYNKFWAERFREFKKRDETNKHKADHKSDLDPVTMYQNEVKQGIAESGSDYHLPKSVSNEPESDQLSQRRPQRMDRYRLGRISDTGLELWAADGDGLGFGLTSMLIGDIPPRFLTWLCRLFSDPATSRSRLTRLESLATSSSSN